MNTRISKLEYTNSNITQLLFKLAEIELDNNKCLKKLIEFEEERIEEGKESYGTGTVSSTAFTIIDLINGTVTGLAGSGDIGGVPNHPVRGYSIINTDSTNSLFIAVNIAKQPQVDADIADTLKTNPMYLRLSPGQPKNQGYTYKCIRNIHLLAVSGTATFKMVLFW